MNRTTTITTTTAAAATTETTTIPVSIIRSVQFQVKLHALLKTEEGIYIGYNVGLWFAHDQERENDRESEVAYRCVCVRESVYVDVRVDVCER